LERISGHTAFFQVVSFSLRCGRVVDMGSHL
jgi:hypothetical protein